MPGSVPMATVIVAGTTVFCAAGLASIMPLPVALFAALQLPLHVYAGVGFGALQARRAFGWMACSLVLWGGARCLVVLLAVGGGADDALLFVVALPSAVAIKIGILALGGGYRSLNWAPASDGRGLLRRYTVWGLFSWLMNADALFAQAVLSTTGADAYAVALTLGRQPIYAAAPLATVLLPVAIGADALTQRHRLHAVLFVSTLLAAAAAVALAIAPDLVVRILSGDARDGAANLIRGYVFVGSAAAAATLLLTLAFALDGLPDLRLLTALSVLGVACAALFVRDPAQLLVLQAATVTVVAIQQFALAWRSTRVERTPVKVGSATGSSSVEP